jgi:hypothetical protein
MLDRESANFMAALGVVCRSRGININFDNIALVASILDMRRVGMDTDIAPDVLSFTVEFSIIGNGDIQTTAHDMNQRELNPGA